jgi:hypothetical protein
LRQSFVTFAADQVSLAAQQQEYTGARSYRQQPEELHAKVIDRMISLGQANGVIH